MYIEPNTTIRVLKNVPLDKTYEHSVLFGSTAQQESYFSSKTKFVFNNQTYQRVQAGKMRVQRKAEDLYDCNYLMFQNTSFGSRWFYAFITGVEYINNVTSEITFEIDVIQTWLFDFRVKECFVEREHSETDAIGSNIVPENFELGEYVTEEFDALNKISNLSIVVACTFDKNYTNVAGAYYSGLYSGLCFNVFENSVQGALKVQDFIHNAGAKTDGIVSVFLMPTAMITGAAEPSKYYEFKKSKNYSSLGGYKPRNNKLFTYPYNFLYVTNLQGNSAVFPYEYFSGSQCEFIVTGDMSCNPSCVLAPQNYKGVMTNYDEKIVLGGYPQLGFNTDSFKAWLAQNGSSLAVNAMSSALQFGAATGSVAGPVAGAVGAGVGLVTSVASSVAQITQAAVKPNQAHGGGGSQTMASLGLLNFGFMKKHIQPQFAKIIDDFFDKFGYSCHRVKVPNISARPHWNYTKTIGCTITGSVPADDMYKICSIYDSGITYWKNPDNVGNYSLNNSI